jgi:hypothetical protein
MARRVLILFVLPFLFASAVSAQTGAVSGQVIDRENQRPVSEVLVRVRGTLLHALTNADGRFRIAGVPVGSQVLLVQHVAFGEHADSVVVIANGDVRLQVRLSRQAIQLIPLVVEAQTELEGRRRAAGHAFNEIVREQIDAAASKGQNLAELLRDGLIGVRVSGERRGSVCVEYRQGGMGLGAPGVRAACREVAVFVDGIRVSAPATIYATIPLRDIERIEVQGPYEAGTRYGIAGGNGVLLIETRQGPAATRRSEQSSTTMTGLDWSLESRPYHWRRVLAGSFVGNAAGLGVGLLLADQCFRLDAGINGLRSKCDALSTVVAGFVVLGLPGVSSSFAARWGGATDRSEGRVVPAGAVYFLLIQANSNDSKSLETAGTLVLIVGTPLVTGVADRVFRRLR